MILYIIGAMFTAGMIQSDDDYGDASRWLVLVAIFFWPITLGAYSYDLFKYFTKEEK